MATVFVAGAEGRVEWGGGGAAINPSKLSAWPKSQQICRRQATQVLARNSELGIREGKRRKVSEKIVSS